MNRGTSFFRSSLIPPKDTRFRIAGFPLSAMSLNASQSRWRRQDYGALGGEGISSRSLSGISEHYRPDYSEKIKAVLRRARKPGVIS